MTDLRARALPLALLVVIIAAGGYVRLAGLGEAHFRGDELRHYYVGQALHRGDGPVLPWGERYARGIDISRLVNVSGRFVSDPELAARLPSALFGVLDLLVFAFVAWAMAGPWAAVWAVLLLAIYPQAIAQSRQVRFYTYQLVFGLVALYAGWRVVRDAGVSEHPSAREVLRTWMWAAVTVACLALAWRVQIVTSSVAAAWGVCLALAALANAAARGWRSWTGNVPLQLIVLALLSVAMVVVVSPGFVSAKLAQAFVVPVWVGEQTGVLAYYYALSGVFPLLIALIPAVFITAALRNPRLSAYLLVWFSVPVLLHSFVFPFKGERFIFLAVPALFLAAGVAAAMACAGLFRSASARLEGLIARPAVTRLVAALSVVVVTGFALLTTPALKRAGRIATGSTETAMKRENWSAVGSIIGSINANEAIPVGSVDRFAPLFYWGRLDFYASRAGECLDGGRMESCPSHSGDVPHLRTASEIRTYFGDVNSVLVVIDSTRLVFGNVDTTLYHALSTEADEVCRGKCGSLMLYHWPLSAASQADGH